MRLFEGDGVRDPQSDGGKEWLLTNGLGGYAMGTLCGISTRRYHALMIAALNPPGGRTMLLGGVDAFARCGDREIALSANAYPGAVFPDGLTPLKSVEVRPDSVRWRYALANIAVEKRIEMATGRNAVRLSYRNLGSRPIQLLLWPLTGSRDHHGEFARRDDYPSSVDLYPARTEVGFDGTRLVLHHAGAMRTPVAGWYYRFEHAREIERALPARDDLYCPCELRFELGPGDEVHLEASLEDVPSVWPGAEPHEPRSLRERLESAAEAFVVRVPRRTGLLAGYPWFSDWGRDTMISLPGILLSRGLVSEARDVLTGYGAAMERGLIPNRFTEEGGADTNTVDATLWFANAVHLTLEAEWDEGFAERMRVLLEASVDWHARGTSFGIKVDPNDLLLRQGERGIQLTWMDAKIDDWVVTPRHGKPVEIQALWINMLRVVARLRERLGLNPEPYLGMAGTATDSFEACFWHEGRGHYLDTVDPDDASLRPNQVIAMALPFTPCDPERARRALAHVKEELLTPVGLRTLGPREPGYHGRFRGDLRTLDAAYHQGTVWPWLLGSYVTAQIRFGGDIADARTVWEGIEPMLEDLGIGGIAECYDGDEPREPNGAPFQCWSIAEALRVASENDWR